jgi:hypothetical protein
MNAKKCYDCKHRRPVPGDAHSACANRDAHVKGHPQGIRGGWFMWPVNFDPTWLMECDGQEPKETAQASR